MLSEKLIQKISSAIGVDDLASKITSEEVIEDLDFGKTKHFTENDYRQQIINIQKDIPKEKWEEAKLAGHEMAIKKLKEDKAIDFHGKSVEDLFTYMQSQIEISKESDISKLKSEHDNNLSILKKTIEEKDKEIEKIKLDGKNSRINSHISNLFNSVQIEVPDYIKNEEDVKKYVQEHKKMHELNFKSKFEKFDIDEYNNIIAVKEGKVLKDSDTLNPVTVDNLFQDYSKNSFMNLKQSRKGRGEGDKYPSVDMTNIKTQEDLEKFAEEKGVIKHTSEYDALYAKYIKNK